MESLKLRLVDVNWKGKKAAKSLNISSQHTTEEEKEILTLGPKFGAQPLKYSGGYLTSVF
jgi:hypothetical protein